MPHTDLFIMKGLGGLFILIGAVALFWGNREEKGYYKAISSHADVREYMEHTPERPEPGGLKVGGIIAIIVGLVMFVMSGALWLWG